MSSIDDRIDDPRWPRPGEPWALRPAPWEPAPGWRFAGIAWRMGALAIDLAICLVVMFGVFAALRAALPAETGIRAVIYLVPLVYLAVGWAVFGATIGMAPFGMHVVRARDGGPIGWVTALGRLGALVVSLGICAFLFGLPLVLLIVLDRRRRGLHDHAVGTVVIRRAWR